MQPRSNDRNPAPLRTRGRWWLWLLPVAVCGVAAGAWLALKPPPPPTPQPEVPATAPEARFVDVTERAGIRFRHTSGATGRKLLPETMGSGVAVLDFDRDGKPDLFFVNSRPWPGEASAGRATQALYRNRGDGTFDDVTTAVGFDVELYGMGVAVGDYDSDGWPDVFVTAVGGNRLFRNIEGKRFEDATDASGLGNGWRWPVESSAEFVNRAEPIDFPSSATWLDYDGDGNLDLFVCYYVTWSPAIDLGVMAVLPGGKRAYVPPQQFSGTQCRLYRNTGGKRFEDVSAVAGVQVSEPGESGRSRAVGKALGVIACDVDGDGWPDIVVANDTVRNFFFHNVPGSNGTRVFQESGLFAGIAYADGRPRGGMGIDAAYGRPGAMEIVIANFTNEPNSLFRLLGTNPIRFVDGAAEAGMSAPSRPAMKFGTTFLDFDRDGRLDLFTANGHLEPDIATAQPGQTHAQAAQLLRSTGQANGRFVAVTGVGGGNVFAPMVGRGCAVLDYDGDGRLDLVVTENNGSARLFRNESSDTNGYVRFVLTGASGNRNALGAEVTVEAGGSVQRWCVTGSRGYLSQSDCAAFFGLGSATKVDRLTVRWPGRAGKVQEWRDVPAGATYRLAEGEPDARRVQP